MSECGLKIKKITDRLPNSSRIVGYPQWISDTSYYLVIHDFLYIVVLLADPWMSFSIIILAKNNDKELVSGAINDIFSVNIACSSRGRFKGGSRHEYSHTIEINLSL